MARDAPLLPLSDLASEIIDRRGVTPRKLGSDFTDAGHRVISAKLIKGGRVAVEADEARFVDAATYQKWMRSPLQADDVIMTSEAPLGELAYLPEDSDWCLGQRLYAIRPNTTRAHGRYLYYALRSDPAWSDIQSRATGTTVVGIRQTELWRVLVPTPPLPEQRAIASVLGALDDKIDLNRRMCQTLEEMARALFKSWFIDFDPVRAKMEGRDPGLPKEIADLFPSRLVDSELGPIPEGWRVVSLSDLVEVSKGASYTSAELQPSSVALLSLKSFARGGGYRDGGLKPFVGRYKESQVVACGDVVMPCTDVTQAAELIGRTARVPQIDDYEIIVASTDVLVLRPSVDSVPRSWLALLGRSPRFVAAMLAHSTGTTVLHLAREAIPNFLTAVPPTTLLARFDEHVSPLMRRSDLCQNQNRTLAALCNTLLPKLISGELRVPASLGSMQEVAT